MDTYQKLLPYFSPFYNLQYPTTTPERPDSFPDSRYYNTGRLDMCLVISMMAVMAILRDAFRLGFFEPLARYKLYRDLKRKREKVMMASKAIEHKKSLNGNGHVNGCVTPPTTKEIRLIERSVMRFAEQGWSVIYYPLQWAFGIYVHSNLPTKILDPSDLWRDYPHIPLAAPVKLYYLSQIAFYTHQLLILNAEARRKDHWQMMTHHVITVILMVSSFFTNFTRVGCIIMVLMDWCDIFLPLAKMSRYLGINQLVTDLTFGWFMVSWLVTRHILFLFVIKSTLFDGPKLIAFRWDPVAGHYVTKTMHHGFSALLLVLQGLQIIWFWMICRIAWRVVVGGSGASDDRSDEEGDIGCELKNE